MKAFLLIFVSLVTFEVGDTSFIELCHEYIGKTEVDFENKLLRNGFVFDSKTDDSLTLVKKESELIMTCFLNDSKKIKNIVLRTLSDEIYNDQLLTIQNLPNIKFYDSNFVEDKYVKGYYDEAFFYEITSRKLDGFNEYSFRVTPRN